MAGYTRNDTPNNIADGNVINASDLDGEFDAIQTAFGTGGHTHDGTAGNGPQIGTGGIANDAVTLGTKTSGNYVATGAVSGVGLSGSASAEGATFTVTSNATDANTASTIVARNASGNFSAGTVTAALTGNVTGDVTGNVIGNVIGNITGSSGSTTGNAATATALETARTIAGQSFDGTANITIASTNLSDSGSIDAATLDSIDSSSFLRSDVADTKTSGDLSFSDNVKAIFGAGNDLQIYHDGSRSIIQDNGTGNLRIQANNLELNNADNSENYLFAANNGAVTLYYDNAAKLATTSTGVDITGELTATTVDATTLQIGNTSITATAAELNYNDITTLGTVEASKTVTADSSGNVTFPNSEKLLIGTGPAGQIEIYHQALTSSTGISYIESDQNLRIEGDGITITDESNGGGFTVTDDGVFINGPLKDTGTLEISAGGIPGVIALSNSINGTTYGNLKVFPGLAIDAPQSDSDITFTGNDGGTAITALTLDMSDAGSATFNSNVYASGNIGLDSTDFISFTGNTRMDVTINGNNEFRFESDGDFHADGDVIAFSTTISDERLKTDIKKIENATDKVSQLNGYTFTYKADGKKSAGVIAQEVEKVLPSAVSEKELPLKMDDDVAYKTVQYDQIIGLLIESIKELKQEINELKGA